jgi:hypothetical protein
LKEKLAGNENYKQTLLAVADEIESPSEISIDTAVLQLAATDESISVDSNVFAPLYTENSGVVKEILSDTTSSGKTYYGNSIDLVYFKGIDIASVKKYLVERKIALVDQNINVLRMKRSLTRDINEKQDITEEIGNLEDKREELNDKVDALDEEIVQLESRGQQLVFDSGTMPEDKVAQRIENQAEEMLIAADSLRQVSENKPRKVRKALKLKAKVLEAKASELNDEANEIIAISNSNKYLENSIAVASVNPNVVNDVRLNQAKQMLENSKTNFELAAENRDAASNPDLSAEEKQSLLTEAANLEQIALQQQAEAVAIYRSKAGVDTLAIASRTPEEIPTDENTGEQVAVIDTVETAVAETTGTPVNREQSETEQQVEEEVTQPAGEVVNLSNLSLETIRRIDPQKLIAINEAELSPELRKEVQIRRSDILGVYVEMQRAARQAFYTAENPIEVQKKLPEGLIYKVQIAAFRREVAPENFKGIKPLSIERRPGSQWYRYLAGNFTAYNDALTARNQIRRIGYKDAFIVPYFNGERITNAQARALINRGEAYTAPDIAKIARQLNKTVYTASQTVAVNVENTQQPVVESNVVAEGDFTTPKLFYAVQIGVYGGPRTKQRLFNISGLYFDRTARGYYRYFSGKYLNYGDALAQRNAVRAAGVPDAFVVAFYNGRKISVGRARTITVTEQPAQPVRNQQQNTRVETNQTTEQRPQNVEPQQSNTPETVQPKYNSVVFKVQLGAYKNNIPIEVVNAFISISVNGIEKITDNNGVTIYLTGNFDNYEDAKTLRDEIASNGIPEAFVVAFGDGKKITVDEAIKALNK